MEGDEVRPTVGVDQDEITVIDIQLRGCNEVICRSCPKVSTERHCSQIYDRNVGDVEKDVV